MKPKVIILDFDGTLGDTQSLIIESLQNTIKAMNLPARSEEACAATIGLSLCDAFMSMYGFNEEEGEKARDSLHLVMQI